MAGPLDLLAAVLADRYRIERELGRGGMAAVFLAEDLKHHSRVAIKVLDPEVGAAIGPERFLREIETVARLTHPHILPLFDSGEAGGLLYYVMPYVEGGSLRDRLNRERQLPVDDALRIAREVADALSCAHRRGLIHRDIKPENILLEEGHAVVADFGIARAVAAAGAEQLTATGVAVGTPAYMSPEQASGGRDLDGRSDLYSLGCVLYEMLAGVPPFVGTTAESLAHQHLTLAPRLVTELRPAVPAAVAAAIQRTLAKAPADRFNAVARFAEALGQVGELAAAQVQVDRLEPLDETRVAKRRAHRVPQLGLGVALVAVLAAAGWLGWGPLTDWLADRNAGPPARKDWILVAEFEGPPDDTTLAVAARSLVSAALDQSEILATLPRDQVRLALQRAGKPANTRVSADIARELAYRSAVRAVLEGDIGRIGQGYSVVLRVVDAESLKVVLTERGSAKDEDALIPVLGKLAERLRRGLGERRAAIAATRPMIRLASPSFEACRLWVRARRLLVSGSTAGVREAVHLYHQALELDPDYVSAWDGLASAYDRLNMVDSSQAALEEILRRPARGDRLMLLGVEAMLADRAGDFEAALDAFDRALEIDASSDVVLANRAIELSQLGRFEEGLESLERAEEAASFGPNAILLSNKVFFLCELGRIEDARQVARGIPGLQGQWRRVYVEMADGRWAAAESLGSSVGGGASIADTRIPACLAVARAGRGAFRDAAGAYLQAEEIAERSASPAYYRNLARRGRLMLNMATRGAIPVPRDTWAEDTSTAMLLARGLRSALAGDTIQARRLLVAARSGSKHSLVWQGRTPALLEAWILGAQGRWDQVVGVLRPALPPPGEVYNASAAGASVLCWTLADAWERSGHADSAVAWLERVTSDHRWMEEDVSYRGVLQSAAHQRLVLLHARIGRLADAERHLAVLERWWDRTDDVSRPMLEEARNAMRSARSMSRPEAGGGPARVPQPD